MFSEFYTMHLWMRLLNVNVFVDASVKCTMHLRMRLLNVFVDTSVKCSTCYRCGYWSPMGTEIPSVSGNPHSFSQIFLYVENFCSLSK